jgi:hypothetical protein
MNLFDMLAGAQGGNGIDALAKQFGLSPQQSQSAVEALMPAFSQGFRQNASDPYGIGNFLTALASGQHAKYFDNPAAAFTPQGMAEGNGILGHLFGSKELSRAVASQAAQATGIGQEVLKQMLPALATMLMGGMFKQSTGQSTGQAAQAGGFGAANNPLGEIIEQMMKQGGGAGRSAPQQSDNPLGDILGQILGGGQGGQSGGGNPMGDILGQILKGGGQGQPGQAPQGQGNNPLGDILGQILGGGRQQAEPEEKAPQRRPQRQQPQAQSDNPLGDILGQILGGGRPQAEPEEEQPRTPPQRRGQRQAPPSNPLEDIFGKMFNPGGQGGVAQDQSYQQGMDNIFEQFRRGVDRRS